MSVMDEAVSEATDVALSAKRVQDEVTRSVRGSLEHLRYATPRVQLAWGLDVVSNRIRHVRLVSNGRNCDCVCPACQEPLVSRQGSVLAWHFAHHNGKECRNAVSAAAAKFLAQRLIDGQGVDLPAVRYVFGGKQQQRPARAGMTFHRAIAREDPASQAWEVLCEIDARGATSSLRILIRTNSRMTLPNADSCRASGVSTMYIDLGIVLTKALEIDPDLCINEDWMTSQIVTEAPRTWIWSAGADRARQSDLDAKIGPYLNAIESHDPGASALEDIEQIVRTAGYSNLLPDGCDPEIWEKSGEFILGPSSTKWRAAILIDTILRPLARAYPHKLEYEATVLGWKQSAASCRRQRLIPQLFMRALPPEVDLELRQARPGFTDAVRVIDTFYQDLVSKGVLRGRPRNHSDCRNTSLHDERLRYIKGASFSISPEFIKDFGQRLKKNPQLKGMIMRGTLQG